MLVAGIDVGAEVRHVAMVDPSEAVVVKPTAFEEDAHGYQELFALLARGRPHGVAKTCPWRRRARRRQASWW